MSYTFQSILAVFRVVLWFTILFGWLAPLFLTYSKKLGTLEKVIYNWIGLGGIIIVSVYVLTMLNLYDFIGFCTILLLIPTINFILQEKRKGKTLSAIVQETENFVISNHVSKIEKSKNLSLLKLGKKVSKNFNFRFLKLDNNTFAILIALIGTFIRLFPAIKNASPFTRNWFFDLEVIKNITVQQYFADFPDPSGMHAVVNVFSLLTQVPAELILHILGGLTGFLLSLIIYWVIKDITKGKYPVAALFGVSIFALFPTLLMPVSLDQQVEANSLELAFCFALPTLIIFIRNLRAIKKAPWYYVAAGFVATGFVNIFALLVVLLPLMVLSVFVIPKRRFLKNVSKTIIYLAILTFLALLPYAAELIMKGLSVENFFRQQLFDATAYSYHPNLITELGHLSQIFIWIAVAYTGIEFILAWINKAFYHADELISVLLFGVIAFLYSPFFSYELNFLDTDQLNIFYGIYICVFAGLVFSQLLRLIEYVINKRPKIILPVKYSFLALTVLIFVSFQGGIVTSKIFPDTLPNSFYDAYYSILNERVPYSYAAVGPEITRISAKNRHYFMNYAYFIENYGAIDSLYQQYLLVPEKDQDLKEVPPASIFVFVEKPPYGLIQQGILYDSPTVMSDLRQWLTNFSNLEGRTLSLYYESDQAMVYEIINREGYSKIGPVLSNTKPKGQAVIND